CQSRPAARRVLATRLVRALPGGERLGRVQVESRLDRLDRLVPSEPERDEPLDHGHLGLDDPIGGTHTRSDAEGGSRLGALTELSQPTGVWRTVPSDDERRV